MKIKFFVEQKGMPMAKLDDDSFLNDLASLVDFAVHFDKLNTKLQGANQIVSHMCAPLPEIR